MSQTNISQILVHSEDRRRFPRHRAFAITYLDLGDDNGGILLNLGGGGLSFQAVAKLNPGQDIALRFGLFTDREMITVTGKVIWLGPTRKEAGVCFAELSDNAEQIIAKWLAAQEAERISAERGAASFGDSEPAPNEIHLLPPQFPAASAASKSTLSDVDTPRAPSVGSPAGVHLSDSFLDHALNRAKTSPVFGTYVPPLMPTRLVSYPKEQPKPAAPSVSTPQEPLDAKQPTIRFLRTFPVEKPKESSQIDQIPVTPAEIVHAVSNSRIQVEPVRSVSPASVALLNRTFSALPILQALQRNRQAVRVMAGVAACAGIIVLLVMTASLDRHSADDGSSAAAVSTANIPAPAAAVANSGPSSDTAAAIALKPGAAKNYSQPKTRTLSSASSVAPGNSVPAPAPPPVAPPIVQQGDSSWLSVLEETLFGGQDKPRLDPVVARVSVWADQRTGFYYCANSPYFVKPERVSLVAQGEALQSGFQPKLGTYCY